jgi:8-oxo-dGTP pyrophosphatase MutT (NUDIX family)
MYPAATVLLLRESSGELEVLMMRRDSALSFMAGMWVFPGGRLDPADGSAAILRRIRAGGYGGGDQLRTRDGTALAPDVTLALQVAACRETFEEAGVLLARNAAGLPCEPPRVAGLPSRRAAIAGNAAEFAALLESEDLFLDLSPLVYWSHWITPSVEPKRFDTRFFAVAVPEDQSASADRGELTHHEWVQPARVNEAIASGRIRVVPPTLLTLEDLAESHARHRSLEAMLLAERGRPAPPVMPRIVKQGNEIHVLMPWDPEYAAAAGEGCPTGEPPPHLLRRRSRVVVTLERETR